MHFPLQPVPAPRHSSCVHSIMMKNSDAESCTSSSKICQEGMQSLHFAVRKSKMEWGYNSHKHHAAGQWQDRNRILEADSWALLCLLITLSTTVSTISIDFKLTHTHILSRRKKSNQEGSLCSAPLEANMILRANFFCKQTWPKSLLGWEAQSRHPQELSNAYKIVPNLLSSLQKTQSTIITCLKCRKETANADAAVTVPDNAPPSLPPYLLMPRSES